MSPELSVMMLPGEVTIVLFEDVIIVFIPLHALSDLIPGLCPVSCLHCAACAFVLWLRDIVFNYLYLEITFRIKEQ